MVFRKMNGPLEEQMGGEIVCDKMYLSVGSTSGLLSCDKNHSSLVDDAPSRGIYDTWFSLEDLY